MATASELRLRPELALGPNPFVEAMPAFVPFEQLPSRLKRLPLDGVPWRSIPPSGRETFLNLAERHVTPCRWSVDIASNIQQLIRRPLVRRNPLRDAEKARTNRIALSGDWEIMKTTIAAEHLDGAGARVSGITGSGKTTLIDIALEIFAPVQVIEYGPCKAGGWNRLVQCVYLRVDHSSNGTRGGLMHRILLAFDRVLGTDYSIQFRKVTNLDTLLTQVCRLICVHRVVLLVIDENQQATLHDSPWRLEFVLFYLHLMNLGTSVLVSGNPLAFEYMRHFAQVERRFSVGGIHALEPAKSADTTWWKDDFIPGMRKFELLDGCAVATKRLEQWEHDVSAGIPGLLRAHRVEAMRAAMHRGGSSVKLLEQDLKEAEASATCKELAAIARSVRERNHDFSDIPGGIGRPVGKPEAGASRDASDGALLDVVSRAIGSQKRQQTQQLNRFNSFLKSLAGLGEEDVRMLGATDELLSQVKALSQESSVHSTKKNPPQARRRTAPRK